ncbi:MAG: hypothetical protein K2H96_08040 [Muribaculaceae bacterium]|nr:hypothetical protein [Muribaculaceae bacterium]
MHYLLSLVIAVMMGVSGAPKNELLNAFYEGMQQEIALQGGKMLYEEDANGAAIIVVQPVPNVTKEELSLSKDELRNEWVNSLKSEDGVDLLIPTLEAENTRLVLRMVTSDGGQIDLEATAQDLKSGVSRGPKNKMLHAYYEGMQQEVDPQAGEKVLYEEDANGAAIIIVLPTNATKKAVESSKDKVRNKWIQRLKSSGSSMVPVLEAEKTRLVLRMVPTDGGAVDVVVTPQDLK